MGRASVIAASWLLGLGGLCRYHDTEVGDVLGEKPRHQGGILGADLVCGLQEEDGALLGNRNTVLAEGQGDETTPLDGVETVKVTS
jgi:hypothetical protein